MEEAIVATEKDLEEAVHQAASLVETLTALLEDKRAARLARETRAAQRAAQRTWPSPDLPGGLFSVACLRDYRDRRYPGIHYVMVNSPENVPAGIERGPLPAARVRASIPDRYDGARQGGGEQYFHDNYTARPEHVDEAVKYALEVIYPAYGRTQTTS